MYLKSAEVTVKIQNVSNLLLSNEALKALLSKQMLLQDHAPGQQLDAGH